MDFPISIKGVLIIDDKVLLLKNERDEWDLPGGRIELGETPENCLIREFLEEVSVNVRVEQIIDSYLFEVIPDKHVFIVAYGCQLQGDFSPQISDEHQEFGLHPINQLENINIPFGYARAIKNWAKINPVHL
ncbi:NUDIX hydrolase [Plectonema cf. radiosum LEGE 06105]|uniref:NUDIX hydrolase n=1 Tax=Plectonema cf. radiosum LEGE 06105 TaxID=945769 RepID=A0A8J7EXJ5_9CYAN|nr:NUDIX hydrolase [Plectonema radiosum]MBE9211633.1 NUDIX hydrolase [Plectonema cf. radiosum LEGE 06105]